MQVLADPFSTPFLPPFLIFCKKLQSPFPCFYLFSASSCSLFFWFGDPTFWPLQELAELGLIPFFSPCHIFCKNLQSPLVDSKLALQIVDYLVVPLGILRFEIVNGIFK